jgi:outer membrane protein assembly factor BamB
MQNRPLWIRGTYLTALVAGSFCLFAVLILVTTVIRQHQRTPLDSPAVRHLKDQLVARPNDEALKRQIRELDLELREGFLANEAIIRRAAWLLVAGGAVLALSLKAYASLSAPLPEAGIPLPPPPRMATVSRWALIVAAVASGVSLSALSLLRPVRLPPPLPPTAQAAETPPTWDQLFANWPSFRGAAGDGVVRQSAPLPKSWNTGTGENILWKTPLRLPGNSSPIYWAGRLYLTGADAKQREVYCFDAGTGESIWTLPLPADASRQAEVFEDTGLAAPTMACDGRRLYAIFPNGDLFAMSPGGERLWERSLGVPDSQYGYSSSLAVHHGRVVVQFDQGEPEAARSALLAFEGATGRPAWRTQRAAGAAWSSPIIYPTRGGDRVFVCGNPIVAAYDPAEGRELWQVSLMEGDVAPSPIYSEGFVYVAGDRAKAAAIPDKDDRPTPVWTSEDNLPDIVSPLCDGENVLLVTGSGTLTCLRASDGKKRWEHDLGVLVQASPLLS